MPPASRFGALVVSLLALGAAAVEASTIFDVKASPSVRLGSIQPMPEALRAILALYAMRGSTGCARASSEGPLRCALSTALGFASQCSPGQVDLVRTWFRDGVPPIDFSAANATDAAAGKLDALCGAFADPAAHGPSWRSLSLDRVGNQIQIRAVLATGENAVAIETRYLVLADRIQVLKHAEKPLR
ncbi:MAG: hypothetical protein ABI609_03670 [Acidobacteriota bacterium]